MRDIPPSARICLGHPLVLAASPDSPWTEIHECVVILHHAAGEEGPPPVRCLTPIGIVCTVRRHPRSRRTRIACVDSSGRDTASTAARPVVRSWAYCAGDCSSRRSSVAKVHIAGYLRLRKGALRWTHICKFSTNLGTGSTCRIYTTSYASERTTGCRIPRSAHRA